MYHIGLGIIDTVYAGTTRKLKNGDEAWIKKDDVTKEFLGVMIEYLKHNDNSRIITVYGKPKYKITLEEISEVEKMTEYKDKWCQEAYNKGFKEGRDFEKGQLTKAKELLNEFMRISKASDEDFEHDYSELIGEAEQFISEVEKNDKRS